MRAAAISRSLEWFRLLAGADPDQALSDHLPRIVRSKAACRPARSASVCERRAITAGFGG